MLIFSKFYLCYFFTSKMVSFKVTKVASFAVNPNNSPVHSRQNHEKIYTDIPCIQVTDSSGNESEFQVKPTFGETNHAVNSFLSDQDKTTPTTITKRVFKLEHQCTPKFNIEIVNLASIPSEVSVLAKWAEDQWGYIRNKGVKYRESVFANYASNQGSQLPQCWVAAVDSFRGEGLKKPIGMVVLLEGDENSINGQHFMEMIYMYVDAPYRAHNVGTMLVQKAMQVAKSMQVRTILFDTLSPSLHKFYQKVGAKRIGEDWDNGRLYGEPVTKYSMEVKSLNVLRKKTSFEI